MTCPTRKSSKANNEREIAPKLGEMGSVLESPALLPYQIGLRSTGTKKPYEYGEKRIPIVHQARHKARI